MRNSNVEATGLRLVASHIHNVQGNIRQAIDILLWRMLNHDQSKYTIAEEDLVTGKPRLDSLEHNSDEYHAALDALKSSVSCHYAVNRHHPEYHNDGVLGMSLFDLLEMLCDWMAASEEHGSDIYESIVRGRKRFSIPPEIEAILVNTAKEMNK